MTGDSDAGSGPREGTDEQEGSVRRFGTSGTRGAPAPSGRVNERAERTAATIMCRGVSKRYGAVAALRYLDLTVHRGEMFALVGPDGAGKTTCLRLLAGVAEQDEGEISILGTQYSSGKRRLPKKRLVQRRVGYLAQGFSLYGDLSVDENIAFFAEIHGVRKYHGRREELLDFTRLKQFRGRLAGRLSGGMKKKLALACALIHDPAVVLLDEPTTGVDPVTRRDFWVILGQLLQTGLTIVVATPYLDEAERCERVGLLNAGSFLAVGSPTELRGYMSGRLIEIVTPEPREARRKIADAMIQEILELQAQGDRLHLRVDASTSTDWVTTALHEAGITISTVREVTPSLENVYISLLREGAS